MRLTFQRVRFQRMRWCSEGFRMYLYCVGYTSCGGFALCGVERVQGYIGIVIVGGAPCSFTLNLKPYTLTPLHP